MRIRPHVNRIPSLSMGQVWVVRARAVILRVSFCHREPFPRFHHEAARRRHPEEPPFVIARPEGPWRSLFSSASNPALPYVNHKSTGKSTVTWAVTPPATEQVLAAISQGRAAPYPAFLDFTPGRVL
jgi:hypothetical protein